MIVYKYFLKIALKHKWIIIGYAAIFFTISIINGTSIKENETKFMEESLNIGVVDRSGSELSNTLVEYLEQKNIIIIMKDDIENIEEQIFLQTVDAVIIFPKEFEELVLKKSKAIEIIRDERQMESIQIENEVNKFLAFVNATYSDSRFDLKMVNDVLNQEIKVDVLEDKYSKKDGNLNTWFKYYFNYTGYIIVAIYVSVIGFIMIEFNDKGIEDRMKVSCKRFLKFNIELYLGQITLAFFITLIFIVGSIFLKGKYISQINFLKYIINIMVFSFSILGFTFLINNLTRSRFVINGISNALSLGSAFISGVFVPQEFLGESVLRIAKFFPTYYFVRINDMTVKSFLDIRYEIFMQVLFGISFFLIGLYFSKIKRSV